MLVAADLDNAVHEFYEHFKPLVERRVNRYINEVRSENMKRKSDDEPLEPDRGRLGELWTEGYRYWIEGEVVQYVGVARGGSGGELRLAETVVLAKRAKYDFTDKSNRGASVYHVPQFEEPPEW